MSPAILPIATDMNTDLTESARKVVNALQAWDFQCFTGLEGTDWLASEPTELICGTDEAAQNATRAIRLGR